MEYVVMLVGERDVDIFETSRDIARGIIKELGRVKKVHFRGVWVFHGEYLVFGMAREGF